MSASPLTPRDACALLGLDAPLGGAELARAFRAAAKASRPDQPGGDAERFRRVIEAYRLLQAEAARPVPVPAPPRSRAQPRPRPRPDPEAVLAIAPREALAGLARTVRLPNGRRLGLRLPAGLRTGETVRLKGQGPGGADLLLTLRIEGEAGLAVIGDDLWMTWPVDPRLLEHGGRTEIDTPAGPRTVWIPRALPRPARLRLKGQGLPAREGRAQGHLFITLEPRAERAGDALRDRLARFQQAWTRKAG